MKKIITIVLSILLLGLIIFYLVKSNKEKYFESIELSDNNTITNFSSHKYVDTVVSLGLDVLNIKDNYVTIRDVPEQIVESFKKQNDMDLGASIIGANDQYIIYINEMSRATSTKIISHELIHLEQYDSNRLRVIGNGVVIWEGKEMNVLDIPYNDRPWEREAFKRQDELEKKLLEKLY
jgi:predicted metallopeptidase